MIGDCKHCQHSVAYHLPFVGCIKCPCDEFGRWASPALMALALACALSCVPHPSPTPVGPTVDGAAPGGCAGLCEHRAKLGCATAQPTAAGADCMSVCRNSTDPAGPWQWDLACRTAASSCAETGCN